MSEKSVAELIGWQRQGEAGLVDVWTLPGGDYRYSDPTVDDLLAWLADDSFWVNINNAWDESMEMRDWQVHVAHCDGDGYNEPVIDYDQFAASAPTLLEALEDVVRQVAGGE